MHMSKLVSMKDIAGPASVTQSSFPKNLNDMSYFGETQ